MTACEDFRAAQYLPDACTLAALLIVAGLSGCAMPSPEAARSTASPLSQLLDRVDQLATSSRVTDANWVSATLGCMPVPVARLEGAERTQLVRCPSPLRANTRQLYTLRPADTTQAATVEINLGPFNNPLDRATVLAQLTARFGRPSCPYTLPAIALCLYGPTSGRPATVSVMFQGDTLSGITVLGSGPSTGRP